MEDALAAVQWTADNAAELGIDPERVAVAGDSAGGNLSTVVSLLARDAGAPRIAFQMLLYPYLGGTPDSYPSLTDFKDEYGLTEHDKRRARVCNLLGGQVNGILLHDETVTQEYSFPFAWCPAWERLQTRACSRWSADVPSRCHVDSKGKLLTLLMPGQRWALI